MLAQNIVQFEVDQVITWATQIAVIVAAISALVVWFRKWLRKQVSDPMQRITDNVVPNGGDQSTSRHLIEEIHREVGNLQASHVSLAAGSHANRELATKALGVAEKAMSMATEGLELSRAVREELRVLDNKQGVGSGD